MRQRRGASPAQRQVEKSEELGAVAESLLKNRVAKAPKLLRLPFGAGF